MNLIDNAVIRKAKNIPVGSVVCFRMESANYLVGEVETKDQPYPQIIHRHGKDNLQFSSYHPGEFLWVILP